MSPMTAVTIGAPSAAARDRATDPSMTSVIESERVTALAPTATSPSATRPCFRRPVGWATGETQSLGSCGVTEIRGDGVQGRSGNLPSGALAARIGERRALLVAAVIEAAGMLLSALAGGLGMLFAGVLVIGLAGSLFGLARQ